MIYENSIKDMPFHEGLGEECGIFGIATPHGSNIDPAYETFTALFSLQHRGQESCGIAVNDAGVISCHKSLGLVLDVFNAEMISKLKGNSAIGHVRYSTTGTPNVENAQPIVVSHYKGNLAVAHNGNLVNAGDLRLEIEGHGGIFHSTNDSEIIAYIIVQERLLADSIEAAVAKAMERIKGAYSLLIMSPRKMIAVRDPNGFRPLCMGLFDGHYIFASESCAIDAVGGTFVRDIEPGEIVVVEDGVLKSIPTKIHAPKSFCSFEFIYFSRPDSVLEGISVEWARQEMGKSLAKLHPVDADIVIGVPDSGISAAIGYASQSGIPYGVGLIKNRYIGRTFIQPSQGQRERAVRLKLNPLAYNVKGKRVIMIDDSIVRGTTSARIVSALRDAGAKEVHMRISSPPFMHPCYFGTDVPDSELLIAYNNTVEETAEIIGADSLAYLPIESLSAIIGSKGCPICCACFSGDYPIQPPTKAEKSQFEQKIVNIAAP
ncbi:MAG: amidophosphoribosyltransferase [Clostridiales Family XIII bacterium]|jgi:amidophosphoribosyltransferase|nr:amidophosphoribosyltransferase [Clostridiales Family XIII bacterium]